MRELTRRQKIGFGVGVVVVAIVLAGQTDESEAPAEPIAVAESTTTTATTRPAPTSTEQSHDWPSEAAYRADIVDTADKLEDLLGMVSEVSFNLADGIFTFEQGVDLMDQAQSALRTHIDHFEGRTPPADFTRPHGLFMDGLDKIDEAFTLFIRGLETGNLTYVDEAVVVLDQANGLIERATAAMP